MTRKAELIKQMRKLGVTGPIIDGDVWGGYDHEVSIMGDANQIVTSKEAIPVPAFDRYDEFNSHPDGVYWSLRELLMRAGWTWDWYDSGTILVFPAEWDDWSAEEQREIQALEARDRVASKANAEAYQGY
jgi:hypothetical protein